MSTTVFKGSIRPGEISAELRPDAGNQDPDLLILGYTPDGGAPVSRQDTAAPGGFAAVAVDAPSVGTIEVFVAAFVDTDGGELSVKCNGAVEDSDTIQGSTRWIYVVVP